MFINLWHKTVSSLMFKELLEKLYECVFASILTHTESTESVTVGGGPWLVVRAHSFTILATVLDSVVTV